MGTRCHYTEMDPFCKRLSFTVQSTFMKENYMLSRECVTAFTQVVSEEPYLLPSELFSKKKVQQQSLTLLQGYIFDVQKRAPME